MTQAHSPIPRHRHLASTETSEYTANPNFQPSPSAMSEDDFLTDLTTRLREFARERDWEQFHTPKNLAMALTVEAAELQEIFQWQSGAESAALEPKDKARVAEEVADVLLYLLRLADVAGIDLQRAALDKLARNAEKYPADKVRGRSDKYSAY